MKKETAGKIQIVIGCVLLLIAIIGSIFIVKYYFWDRLESSGVSLMTEYGKTCDRINCSETDASVNIVSSLMLESTIISTVGVTFIFSALTLMAVSVVLITQGLININKR